MNSWILLADAEEIVVRNGEAPPVRVVISRGLHPAVVYEGTYVYPYAWKGFIHCRGACEHWQYPTGPVREVRIRKDNDGSTWVLVIWK